MSISVSAAALVYDLSGSVTTTSFPVSAGDLVVAETYSLAAGNTVTDSGGGTWTARTGDGYTKISTRPCPSLESITVTLSNGSAQFVIMRVFLVSAQHQANPVGSTGSGNSTTNNYTPAIFTSTQIGSVGFVVAIDNNNLGAPSSSDLEIGGFSGLASRAGIMGYKTLGGVASQTANLNAYGASAAGWYWRALEITPRTTRAPYASQPPQIWRIH